MKSIDVNQIKEFRDKQIIDVREKSEYDNYHIEGTRNIPLMGLLQNSSQFLKKECTYYIMCHSGSRSAHAVQFLEKQGYDVINLAGGITSYKE